MYVNSFLRSFGLNYIMLSGLNSLMSSFSFFLSFLFCETLHQGDMQETHKSRITQVYGGGSEMQERGQRT